MPEAATAGRPTCPDGGACHHWCPSARSCFRVECCGPLSGVFPDNYWPAEIRAAHVPWSPAGEPDASPVARHLAADDGGWLSRAQAYGRRTGDDMRDVYFAILCFIAAADPDSVDHGLRQAEELYPRGLTMPR